MPNNGRLDFHGSSVLVRTSKDLTLSALEERKDWSSDVQKGIDSQASAFMGIQGR